MQLTKLKALLFTSLLAVNLYAQDDLDVIGGKSKWLQYTDAGNALYHHFANEAFGYLQDRQRKVSEIKSWSEWQDRQAWIKKTLQEVVGPFPEKSPLNPRVTRTIEKADFRVEHIVFESQPGFYVTSSLYIPKSLKRRAKAPAIVYCSGHAAEGYRSNVYQNIILNLVKKGFIVFAFDPVGQGERLEYLDSASNRSRIGGPTSEHSYPGSQAFIAGSSQARYMIWDGIRAVDYLLSRREVDPARIGITGRSGGGTQSSYIAAFDDRIKAAAPECYITNFTRLLQSIGPQDAEQNFFNGISKGLDHADLLIVRAPKPTLMITTTRDMFSIQGARETAQELSRAYQASGNEAAFGMVEDNAAHASTKKNREAMYAFFQKHLDNPGSSEDQALPSLTADELRVTPTGQVSTSLGGETVFSLVNKEVKDTPADAAPSEVISHARALSGYREPAEGASRVFTGTIQRDGYTIEKYFVRGEGECVIPYLTFKPEQPSERIVLYLNPNGKSAEAEPGGEMEWFVKQGFIVVAPDLTGLGEMGSGDFKGDAFIGGVSHNIWYASILVGRSIVGVHAADITRVIRSLETNTRTEIYGLARKESGPALLHAAAFNTVIKKVGFIEPLVSWRSLVSQRDYFSPFITGAVAGSLQFYDLPHLAAMLAPRNLLVVNPLNGEGKSADSQDLEESSDIVRKAYTENSLIFEENVSDKHLKDLLSQWLQQ